MEVERKRTGDVVLNDGLVDVYGPLGSASGPTRKVEERHRFGVGRADFVRPGHFGEKVWKKDRALRGRFVDDQHVLEGAESVSLRSHPPAEEACSRDQHSALADLEALAYRLGPKGREEGTQNTAVLERTERGDIKLKNPWQEHEDPVPDANPQVVQRLREAARELRQLTVCDVAYGAACQLNPARAAS